MSLFEVHNIYVWQFIKRPTAAGVDPTTYYQVLFTLDITVVLWQSIDTFLASFSSFHKQPEEKRKVMKDKRKHHGAVNESSSE